MRRVTLHNHNQVAVIEVDGDLDLVAAHDLRHALCTVLRTTTGVINLDLSQVATADDDGIAVLEWCSKRAITARRRLMWSGCSLPLTAHLRASNWSARAETPRTQMRD